MRNHYVSEVAPYGAFCDEGACGGGAIRLRGGGTLVGWDIIGPSYERTSDDDVSTICQAFGDSFRQWGTGDFVHVVINRVWATDYPKRQFPNRAAFLADRERADAFASAKHMRTIMSLYASNQDEGAVQNYLKALFFSSTEHQHRGTVERQMQRFLHRCEQWEDSAARLKPRRLSNLELWRRLILAVNGTYYDAPLPRGGVPLNHVIGQQDFIGGSEPQIGQLHIRPVSLVHPWPKRTTEQVLATLLTQPGELMLSCRFVCLDQTDAEAIAQLERKHYIREANGTGIKQWFMNAFKIQQREGANQDVEELIAEADTAIADIQKGVPYGWASIAALVMGEDKAEVNSRVRQVQKDLLAHQHGVRIENAHAVEVVQGSWPGQGLSNERRPLVASHNFTDISLPVSYWQGTPEIDSTFIKPKGTVAPLIVSGSGDEPFFFPSHIRSVGHTLIVGATTGGKSTLIAAIVVALVVLPNVRILWLDRDYSSFVLTHALGGTYIELAGDDSSPLCPFQWLDAPDGVEWLFDWFVRLLSRWQIEITPRMATDLRTALNLAKATGIRNMTLFVGLIHVQQVREVLLNYTKRGQWGHIFDCDPLPNVRRTLTTYEMRHLDPLGERVSAAAVELIFRDAEVGLGVAPTFVVSDEAKWLFSSAVGLPFLDKGYRRFRKFNGAIIAATQSPAEIEDSAVRALLVESTAIKIFLPNRSAQTEQFQKLYTGFGLKEMEIEILAAPETQLQRDYLCSTEYGSRLFRLDLGKIGKALCASTGTDDVTKARALLTEYGPERFLEAWLWSKGLGPKPEPTAEPINGPNQFIRTDLNGSIKHAAV